MSRCSCGRCPSCHTNHTWDWRSRRCKRRTGGTASHGSTAWREQWSSTHRLHRKIRYKLALYTVYRWHDEQLIKSPAQLQLTSWDFVQMNSVNCTSRTLNTWTCHIAYKSVISLQGLSWWTSKYRPVPGTWLRFSDILSFCHYAIIFFKLNVVHIFPPFSESFGLPK